MNLTLRLSKWMFFICVGGAALLVASQIALPDTYPEGGAGCYWNRSWFDEVRCAGFFGAPAVQVVFLILTLGLMFGPLIFLFLLIEGSLFATIAEKPDLFGIAFGSVAVLMFASLWPIVKMRRWWMARRGGTR